MKMRLGEAKAHRDDEFIVSTHTQKFLFFDIHMFISSSQVVWCSLVH